MRKFDEVRMFLAGDEYEVREISAAALLDAKRAARDILGEGASLEGDGELILSAAVAAESLYLNGEKAFATATDALMFLTAAEITQAASVNALPERKSVGFSSPEISEKPEKKEDRLSDDAGNGAHYRTADVSVPEAPNEKRADIDTGASAFKADARDMSVPNVFSGGGSPFFTAGEYESGGGGSADMRYISGFFERDSRRYGGAFEKF